MTSLLLQAMQIEAAKKKVSTPSSASIPVSNPAAAKAVVAKKMTPLNQLLRLSLRNEPDNTNARYVKVIGVDNNFLKDGSRRIRAMTETSIPGQEKRKHHQHIVCRPAGFDGKFLEAPGISVDCTCKRFMFMWEYALSKVGAALIFRSNGQPAEVLNPTNKVACCKHVTKLMAYISAKNM